MGLMGDTELQQLTETTGSIASCTQKSAHDELFAVQALLLHINATLLQKKLCAHCLWSGLKYVTVQIMLCLQLL